MPLSLKPSTTTSGTILFDSRFVLGLVNFLIWLFDLQTDKKNAWAFHQRIKGVSTGLDLQAVNRLISIFVAGNNCVRELVEIRGRDIKDIQFGSNFLVALEYGEKLYLWECCLPPRQSSFLMLNVKILNTLNPVKGESCLFAITQGIRQPY